MEAKGAVLAKVLACWKQKGSHCGHNTRQRWKGRAVGEGFTELGGGQVGGWQQAVSIGQTQVMLPKAATRMYTGWWRSQEDGQSVQSHMWEGGRARVTGLQQKIRFPFRERTDTNFAEDQGPRHTTARAQGQQYVRWNNSLVSKQGQRRR